MGGELEGCELTIRLDTEKLPPIFAARNLREAEEAISVFCAPMSATPSVKDWGIVKESLSPSNPELLKFVYKVILVTTKDTLCTYEALKHALWALALIELTRKVEEIEL